MSATCPLRRQGTYGAYLLLFLPPLIAISLFTAYIICSTLMDGSFLGADFFSIAGVLVLAPILWSLMFFGYFGIPIFLTALVAERIAGREPLIPWLPFTASMTFAAIIFATIHQFAVSEYFRVFYNTADFLRTALGTLIIYLIATSLTWRAIRRANSRILRPDEDLQALDQKVRP